MGILWKIIKEKCILFRIFNRKSIYELKFITLSVFTFYISIIFQFNAFCYTDDMIIYLYRNKKNKVVLSSFIRIVLSVIIRRIVYEICQTIIVFPSSVRLLIENPTYDSNTIRQYIQKYHNKVFIFTIIIFSVTAIIWYYCTLFCIVYYYTQTSWIIGGCISIILELILSMIFCVLLSLLRVIALSSKPEHIYNIELCLYKLIV